MARFVIRGKQPLNGPLKPAGNKNAALPMLAAALLTDEPVKLRNVPDIADVRVMLELLADLGVEVSARGHTVTLCARDVKHNRLDTERCRRVRSSILLAGPLLARCGGVSLPPPGGDVIGLRRLDTHFLALRALGAQVTPGKRFRLQAKRLKGAEMLLDEASVTATENALMAAATAKGRTEIYNAACEPHVQDLARLLIRMGADISGVGTNRLVVRGVSRLHGATHTVGPDYTEIGSFLAAAAATGGQLQVSVRPDTWGPVVARGFERLGYAWRHTKNELVFKADASARVKLDLARTIPKIEDGIWPAFPSDLMSVMIVLATQVPGSVLFYEKLFESRMYFVDSLISMGAKIVQCDPHRVLVVGPSELYAGHMNSPDIRAGMALIVAALCAKGESIIDNAEVIDRGYERIEERLRALGADIERVD